MKLRKARRMNTKTNRSRGLLAVVLLTTVLASAYAFNSYLTSFNSAYPAASGKAISDCLLCHVSGSYGLNPYGSAYRAAGYSFSAIENADSDGDGFTNIQEINALTFPGNPASYPATPTPDATPPSITAFSMPATSSSLTVPVTLTASDNVGVTGYRVSESSATPAPGSAGWTASAPTSFTFGSAGAKTLYAWAKDAANNVSASRNATTTISIAPPADTTPPSITAFSMPATSSSLTVPVTLTASDNVGVTGYRVSENSATPVPGSAGWTASAPTSFTFAGAGAKTLYAWARDAANNVSAGASATTAITLPPAADTTAPTVNAFSIPPTSSSLTVSITSLVASDNVGVTGYQITESSAAPAAGATGWTASSPSSYTFASAGTKTLYAWAKDAAGNVSASRSATTTITLPSAPDTTAPTVDTFSIPATSSSLTVPITSLTASDNVGVTGYMVTESSTKPPSSAAGWSASPQANFTFTGTGAKMLFAWAKDAAGNVSNSRSASTTINAGDTSSPDMTAWVGKWFKVRINRDAGKESWKRPDEDSDDNIGEIGYLKILSWDSSASTLKGSLYYRNGQKGPWSSVDLPLHFTGGTPVRFLFWFEYAQEFQFAAGMIAKAERGMMAKATFSAAGIYLFKNEDEMDDDVNLALTIVGTMIPEWKVPTEIVNN